MALTDYTDYDTIRAVLGVSDEELEDTTLALPMYMDMLELGLGDIYNTLPELFESIKANPTPTPQQTKLVKVVQLYSAYFIASELLTSLTLFAPKRIADGRAEMERVVDPFKDVKEGVRTGLLNLRNRIRIILGDLSIVPNPVATFGLVYAVGVPLSLDPVTNT